ncbi:hypothetical protein ABZV60_29430 [Streptomyces sp. NPDC004787]|uniref:hypothetical protein n=1 Tax=Streptomyces sp. NPDC004787 TaxID=3154291 RepID=UPI0033A5818E
MIGALRRRRWAEESKKFLIKLDKEGPDGLAVDLVSDDCATRKTLAVKAWVLAHLHFSRPAHPGSAWSSGGSPS